MKKINRAELEGPDKECDLIGEMLASLTDEAIRKAYTMTYRCDIMHLFLAILHSLGQNYINSNPDLPPDEYIKIVDNLAALTGLTNGYYYLETDEMAYCILNGIIPLNMDAEYDDVDPSKPALFISKERFDSVIDLAMMILFHYERPELSTLQSNTDNLYIIARDCCEEIYQTRKYIAARLGESQDKSSVGKQTDDGTLDFNL